MNLKNKISFSGYLDEDDYLYKHLVLTATEYEKLSFTHSALELSEILNVDFISIIYEGEVSFIHISDVDCEEEILSTKKLIGTENAKYDLYDDIYKDGVYAIKEDSDIGLENVKDYFMDKRKDELLIVRGEFEGKYKECIFGEGHEGYLVLLKENSNYKNIETEIYSIDDFLFL